MKLIVISGSHRNIGKTTLVRKISDALKDCPHDVIKIGHEEARVDKPEKIFTSMDCALECIDMHYRENKLDYLIVESNSVIAHRTPDLLLFIHDEHQQKPSATLCKEHAHLSTEHLRSEKDVKKILLRTVNNDVLIAALDIFIGESR